MLILIQTVMEHLKVFRYSDVGSFEEEKKSFFQLKLVNIFSYYYYV